MCLGVDLPVPVRVRIRHVENRPGRDESRHPGEHHIPHRNGDGGVVPGSQNPQPPQSPPHGQRPEILDAGRKFRGLAHHEGGHEYEHSDDVLRQRNHCRQYLVKEAGNNFISIFFLSYISIFILNSNVKLPL